MNIQEIYEKYNDDKKFSYEDFVTPSYSGGHNKWIVKYPKTNTVFKDLKDSFHNGEIDFAWIADQFGGRVAEYVTNITQQEANKLGKVESISWNQFLDIYGEPVDEESLTRSEWNQYRKPQLIDYITAKDLKAKKLDMNSAVIVPKTAEAITVRDFLLNKASFRTISKTQYNIFSPHKEGFNGGIFARNGDLKATDPKEVGEFMFQISVDEMNYKKDLDNIQKLWEWRTGRNEKRSVLEEHHGYDTKHASHLFRLLIGAKNILTTGEYHPRLKGANLSLVKSILNGEHEYEWVVAEAAKMEAELETLYKESKLPKTPNHKKANELLLELSREF